MPNKELESFRVGELHDRRRKLPRDKHKEVFALRREGWSLQKLADYFGVSKRLITFILVPDRILAARKNRDWKDYYTKEKRKLDMRKHRAHKKDLLLKSKGL